MRMRDVRRRDEPRHTIAMPPDPSGPGPDEVFAFHAGIETLTRDATSLARALAWLDGPERERYDRFHADHDRRMFLLGRVMARALVGRALGLPPLTWQWRDGSRGRPEIAAPETPLRFNLSHSAGLVACALATGRDVGIDVEHLRRRPLEPGIVRRYCSPAEADDIESRGDRWQQRFLVYWTLKEAYLKARGLGVAVNLVDVSFTPGPDAIRVAFRDTLEGTDTRWAFELACPTPDHLVAVAAGQPGPTRPAITLAALPVELLP